MPDTLHIDSDVNSKHKQEIDQNDHVTGATDTLTVNEFVSFPLCGERLKCA